MKDDLAYAIDQVLYVRPYSQVKPTTLCHPPRGALKCHEILFPLVLTFAMPLYPFLRCFSFGKKPEEVPDSVAEAPTKD